MLASSEEEEREDNAPARTERGVWSILQVCTGEQDPGAEDNGTFAPCFGDGPWLLSMEAGVTRDELGAAQSVVMAVAAGKIRAQFREVRSARRTPAPELQDDEQASRSV
jgi:hypothetical protein